MRYINLHFTYFYLLIYLLKLSYATSGKVIFLCGARK